MSHDDDKLELRRAFKRGDIARLEYEYAKLRARRQSIWKFVLEKLDKLIHSAVS